MKEKISALIDDELDLESSKYLFTALKTDTQLGECWSAYHLIGDTMRGNCFLIRGFHDRLMQKLEQEPTVLAPRNGLPRMSKPSSFLLSTGSAAAAVAFVGWMVWSQYSQSPDQVLTPSMALNNAPPQAMNSYLLAHQEFSVGGGLQSASYIRTVALTGDGN